MSSARLVFTYIKKIICWFSQQPMTYVRNWHSWHNSIDSLSNRLQLAAISDDDFLRWLTTFGSDSLDCETFYENNFWFHFDLFQFLISFTNLHFPNNIVTFDNTSEYNMHAIKPIGFLCAYEKLRTICITTGIRHRHHALFNMKVFNQIPFLLYFKKRHFTGPSVFQNKIFVVEFFAIYWFSTGSISLMRKKILRKQFIPSVYRTKSCTNYPFVKSPPWHINWGIIRWNELFLNP